MKVSNNQKWHWGFQHAREPGMSIKRSWFFVMDEDFNSLSYYGKGIRITIRDVEFHLGHASSDRLSRALDDVTTEEIMGWQRPESRGQDVQEG